MAAPAAAPAPNVLGDPNGVNVDDIIEELTSTRVDERSGRAQDKEDAQAMERLGNFLG